MSDRLSTRGPRRIRGAALALAALLAFSLCLLLPLLARAQSASTPASFEVPITLESQLLDPEGRPAATVSLRLSCYEWQDREGTRRFVMTGGKGEAEVTRASGAKERLELGVTVSRQEAKEGVAEALGDGSRRWLLAGGVVLEAKGEAPAEMEIEVGVLVPREGALRAPATIERPEGTAAEAAGEIAALKARGDGGELRAKGALWGLPAQAEPRIGVLRVTKVATVAPKMPAAGREADRIIARLQYVAGDYGGAVRDGVVLDPAAIGEQVRMLEETIALSESLKLPQELHEKLLAIRKRVEGKAAPTDVAEACRAAVPEVVSALWASMTPPAPGALTRGAALFAERCAACHGAAGDGRGTAAGGIAPERAALRDPELVELLSPYRAFHAISFGVPGTAMPAHDGSKEERWALAFHVFSFHHGAGAEEGARAMERAGLAVPSLEELSLRTDRELRSWLARKLPEGDVAPALAYLRTGAVGRAAASPFEAMRRALREGARAYRSDRGLAAALIGEAAQGYRRIDGEVRRRDQGAAASAEEVLRGLEAAITEGAPAGDVQAAAQRAFSALGRAEAALAGAPRSGGPAGVGAIPRWALLAIPVALVVGALLVARYRRGRGPEDAAAGGGLEAAAAGGLEATAPGGGRAAAGGAGAGSGVPLWAVLLGAGVLLAIAFVGLKVSQAGPRGGAGAAPGSPSISP